MKSTIDGTLDHVLLLARHLDRWNPRGAVIAMLMELGTPTQSAGFELLKFAILLFYENPTRSLHKDIYKQAMLHYDMNTEEQVDQAIREAIRKAFKNGSKEAWDWYFGYDGKRLMDRPSNAEFISRLARILEMWSNHSEEAADEEAEV